MAFTAEELQIFRDEISRYTQQHIVPVTTPYEHPMDAQTMSRLVGGLESMGVISQIEDEPIGLWSDAGDASTTALSLDLLRVLGVANAALALVVHRKALTNWLLRETGLSAVDAGIALTVTGHYGLARSSLGKWLRAETCMAEEDTSLLADWLDRHEHESVICALPGFEQVLWPIWKSDAIQWQLIANDQLNVATQEAHGLDELDVCTVGICAAAAGVSTDMPVEQSRKIYANVLKMELLGLTAIGLGVLERSSKLAIEFSAIRSQGGKLIREHPAVQIMLSEIRSVIKQVERLLLSFQSSVEIAELADVASLRFTSSDPLVHACHQVIQIHGGIGYMRDAGPEKYVRDQNVLQLLSGGTSGLPLFIHGVEQ